MKDTGMGASLVIAAVIAAAFAFGLYGAHQDTHALKAECIEYGAVWSANRCYLYSDATQGWSLDPTGFLRDRALGVGGVPSVG